MEHQIIPQILFMADLAIFFLVILMHLAAKNVAVTYLYAAQSLLVSLLLIYSSYSNHSFSLLAVAFLIFAVKVLIAPSFFLKLINKHQLQLTASNYLSLPLTLVGIGAITTLTHSRFFAPLSTLSPANQNALLITIAAMFISLFLIINRKGILSQMIGVLSLENSIVAFVFAAGLEQGPGLELGIIFDVFVWIIIATVFVSMVYKKFNTLDVTVMNDLKG